MDIQETENVIRRFILDKLEETGASGAVIGLSGGLDSAVVLKLCVETLGNERVHALLMPEKLESNEDAGDAKEYAKDMGVEYKIIEIEDIVNKFLVALEGASGDASSNIKARTRMTLLYGYAYDRNLIVMGTSNKSELLTGYFTKFGDGGADFMPLGDLYKTQVVELAKHIGVPEKFIKKKPSAGLYPGQTDENDLGMGYETLDRILQGMEKDLDDEDIAEECGVEQKEVARIRKMVRMNAHKRKMPIIPKIGLRTVGWDWRE